MLRGCVRDLADTPFLTLPRIVRSSRRALDY